MARHNSVLPGIVDQSSPWSRASARLLATLLQGTFIHHVGTINAGELRWVLFGSVRRVRPEDLEAYIRSRSASRPPADEDWCTVADLMRATGFSRSKAYKLLARGAQAFKVFAGTRHVRSKDFSDFLRSAKNARGIPS